MTTKTDSTTDKMATMREQYSRAVAFDSTMRSDAADDLRFGFIPGNQWDARHKQRRLRKNRPCYEFNKIRQHSKQVTNDLRQNRPQIKIKATKEGTKRAGEIMQGLIRNIEAQSHADQAYDTAGWFATNGGFGVIRLTTEYSDDSSFDLDIRIKEVRNPLGVYFDPSAKEQDKRDGGFAFVPERISRKEFKRRFPEADAVDFAHAGQIDQGEWWGADDVMIAEYWERDPVKKKIVLLSDGRVIDGDKYEKIKDELANPPPKTLATEPREPVTMVRERVVDTWKVQVSLVSGSDVLEGPTPWLGKWIPLVPVWGDLLNIDGKEFWHGMIRHAKDAQRLYNYNRTTMTEVVAKQPKSPFLYTAEHVRGYEAQWESISEGDAEGLPYNPDPKTPGGKPSREPPPAFPVALLQLAQIDSDDIKAITGQYDPSLGARKGQQSGRAILALQREGDVANFDYSDNLARAIRFVGELLVDLVPKIMDTERTERILGEDGAEEWVTINEQVFDDETQEWVTINDLSLAKYDVVVQAGPSYTTLRQEAADALMQLANSGGPAALIALYGAIKNMDVPYSGELLEALRRLLIQGNLMKPGPEDEPPPAPQPNPKDVAGAEKDAAQARKANAEADQTEIENRLMAAGIAGAAMPMQSPDPMGAPPDPGGANAMTMFEEPAQAGSFVSEPPADWPFAQGGMAVDPYPDASGPIQ
ncbi:hypothetical protein J5226_12900 [Lysobacter sp. K5869]|uniref:portal protein n=1 Tax=Lysobacter sp. K5869 TaxID=2820808 RepID=UPI001C06237C|nr:portal protein [Lysobacter sp. K5869]QWP79223.1 hypothetical protein J5226_12900 [Lysobacter sp. K5869]